MLNAIANTETSISFIATIPGINDDKSFFKTTIPGINDDKSFLNTTDKKLIEDFFEKFGFENFFKKLDLSNALTLTVHKSIVEKSFESFEFFDINNYHEVNCKVEKINGKDILELKYSNNDELLYHVKKDLKTGALDVVVAYNESPPEVTIEEPDSDDETYIKSNTIT
jgi:hypothetical protein